MTLPLELFYLEQHHRHAFPGHPECPERVEAIRTALEKAGWWQEFTFTMPMEVPDEVLESVHQKKYLENLRRASQVSDWLDADTYTTEASWQLALQAAGGVVALADRVWKRDIEKGFALCRPPGHHATPGHGMGFCLLNHVALAAQYLCLKAKARVAILDVDLHHGNGTQEIFWEREDVLYVSIHQAPFYPFTGEMIEIGAGKGKGFTLNIPLPEGSGDEAYRTVIKEMVLPKLELFQPDMVLVSFGFDTHWMDPIGGFLLSAGGIKECLSRINHFADENCLGRLAVVLEGGYTLRAAGACGMAVVSALTGKDWVDSLGISPYSENAQWKERINRIKALKP